MSHNLYRYRFASSTPIEDVEATLCLAIVAVESLYGETDVQLDAGHFFDAAARLCVIDASTNVGKSLNRLFAGYLRREFGADAFVAERVDNAEITPGVARGLAATAPGHTAADQ